MNAVMRIMGVFMKGAIAVRNTVLWCAAFACALIAGVATAGDASLAQSGVWAIGLPDGYIVMEPRARVIQVTAEGVMQGTPRQRSASRIFTVTRPSAAYTVDFHVSSALLRAVGIEGIAEHGENLTGQVLSLRGEPALVDHGNATNARLSGRPTAN